MNDFFALYECLIEQIDSDLPITGTLTGSLWACVSAGDRCGMAMATRGSTIPPVYPEGLLGLPLTQAAAALKSWNLEEASLALAAINAALNTAERVQACNSYVPLEIHYTDDLDFTGKTVGVVGHMRGSKRMHQQAKQIYYLERDPKQGDYPDPACEVLLPQCDIALITGSSLINKTLPGLLTLSRDAYTVLTGPSVPLCPALLDFGIDRLAGLAITDPEAARNHVAQDLPGSPYRLGIPFILSK